MTKKAREELTQLKTNLANEVNLMEELAGQDKLSREERYFLLPALKKVKAFLKIKSNSTPNDTWNDTLYTAQCEFLWWIMELKKIDEEH